jgi:hypothetical protein
MMSEWKLVPVEPTSEMTAAACHVVVEQDRGGVQCLWPTEAQAIYAAMLSAAPEPREAQPVADMPAVVQVPQGLIEAVDRVLEEAHCDCPQRLRFDDGQHLSGCPLFDLNVARLAMLDAAPPQPEAVTNDEVEAAMGAFCLDQPPRAAMRAALLAAMKVGGER